MTREEIMRAEIARRGLTVSRQGLAFWIRGHGVDVLVASLASLSDADLKTVKPREIVQMKIRGNL